MHRKPHEPKALRGEAEDSWVLEGGSLSRGDASLRSPGRGAGDTGRTPTLSSSCSQPLIAYFAATQWARLTSPASRGLCMELEQKLLISTTRCVGRFPGEWEVQPGPDDAVKMIGALPVIACYFFSLIYGKYYFNLVACRCMTSRSHFFWYAYYYF